MNWKWLFCTLINCLCLVAVIAGCAVTVPPQADTGGMEKYPTKKEQLVYHNFMLGRLKDYENNEEVDLVTLAFLDGKLSNDHKLDEYEQEILQNAVEAERLYFTVGWPIYNPSTGKPTNPDDRFLGVPTSNPLDYAITSDVKRWKGIPGGYITFEDAQWGFSKISVSKNQPKLDPWGIIEVDFVPIRYGRPARVVKAWRVNARDAKQFYQERIVFYKVDPSVCKLLYPEFKIIYVQ